MMKRIFMIGFLIFRLTDLFSQNLKNEYQKIVINFINQVKNNNKDNISNMISYPFHRDYPIKSIKDKKEFISRYDEIFDDSLKYKIIKSNPAKDWAEVGWRGIMLYRGDLWLDFDGRISSINYQSKSERLLKEKTIETDRKNIHPSLLKFESPVCILKTSKYLIRIDLLGKEKYRYASWSITKSMIDKPDLVINNGECIYEGSGGNHSYKFQNDGYIYECSIIIMGEEGSPPAILTVSKGDKDLIIQNATIEEK